MVLAFMYASMYAVAFDYLCMVELYNTKSSDLGQCLFVGRWICELIVESISGVFVCTRMAIVVCSG